MPKRRRFRRINLSTVAILLLLSAALTWAGLAHVRPSNSTTAKTGSSHRPQRKTQDAGLGKASEHPPAPLPARSVDRSVHVKLGVPTDANPSDDYLIDHGVYVLSYDPGKNVANWVAWQLTRASLGHVRRKNDFRADTALPTGFYRVVPGDYKHSGYDRGHLCPSADREATPGDNSLTFLMTNIQPQLHELNEGPWEKLEEYERELARQRNAELFIVAGGIFTAARQHIGNGIAVPKASYKIIVPLRLGQSAPDVKSETQVIAVVMPNEPGVGSHAWTEYITSVDAVEEQTGYDFLTRVPKRVQDVIEATTASPPRTR